MKKRMECYSISAGYSSHGVVALFWSIKYYSETNETDGFFFRLISVSVYVYAPGERKRRRVPPVTGDKWAQEAGGGERAERIYTDCRILKGTVRFYWIIQGSRGGEEGIKILDGNEPPEVISFRLLFYYPSHENSYFFYVMLISFSVRHRRGVKCAYFYILYEVQNGNKTKRKKRKLCNCNYCIFFFFFLRFYSDFFIISTIKHGLAIKQKIK